MAYNYSEWFLTENVEAVRWLVKLAGDVAIGQRKFEVPELAREYRYKINNLLATLARNHPDQAWVKNRLRTWIAYDGYYTVFVGVPPAGAKLRGPKSHAVEVGVESRKVLELQEIAGTPDLLKIMALLLPPLPLMDEVLVRIPPPSEAISWFQSAEAVNPDSHTMFEVVSTQPHLRLRRVPATS